MTGVQTCALPIFGAWAAWRHRRGGRGPGGNRPLGFYRRALRAAARRGLRPAVWETAREFSGRVSGLGPVAGAAFARVTALYERARFGGTPPSPAELEEAEASLVALGRARR